MPADIEIRGNHLRKSPPWINQSWTEKNLLELKMGIRVEIEANIFEESWEDQADNGQSGFAILLTVRNQSPATDTFAKVEHVRVRYNKFARVGRGIQIFGEDPDRTSAQSGCIWIGNNLFESVGYFNSSFQKDYGDGLLFHMHTGQMATGAHDVTIDHNTAFPAGDVDAIEEPSM